MMTKSLELFAGSCSFSNVAKTYGYNTVTTDIKAFNGIDFISDILNFNIDQVLDNFGVPDIVWASPPCTYFSVASIGKHWNLDNTPKTKQAALGIKIIEKTIDIINAFKRMNKDLAFICENPRGKLRKLNLLDNDLLHTVTYCQYGDSRMKPTDIWTNINWTPRKMCKNGQPCHEAAPRGSRTGTQGLKGNFNRSKVPNELCQELIEAYIKEVT
tara:strand:+ start:51 stop:692 length:642 start_codon:yes stop_codon:yes gene_type:complete